MANYTVCAITTPHLPNRAAHLQTLLTRGLDGVGHRYVTAFEPDEVARLGADVVDPAAGMHRPQVSNALKHVHALRLVAQGSMECVLVLEDDALMAKQGCGEHLERVVVPWVLSRSPCSVCFLGQPRNSGGGDDVVEQELNDTTELFVNAYLVTRDAAVVLLERGGLLPVRSPANAALKTALMGCRETVACLRSGVPVLIDGSKYAYFSSTLSANNRLIFNPHYMRLSVVLNHMDADPEAAARAVERESDDPDNVAASHPDFLALVAEWHCHRGRYREAERLLRRAHESAGSGTAIVNNASRSLVRLIELHRHLQ